MTDHLNLSRRGILGGALGSGLLGAPIVRAQAQQAGLPRKGGILRFCRPDPPDMLDPLATNSNTGLEWSQMVYDNLVILNSEGQPKPQLALSWQAEKAGLEWVVTLRQGVTFHDGSALTSADVAATIERSMDKAKAGAGFGAFGPVREVRTEAPDRLRVVMNLPFGEFPVVMAYRSCRILPAKGIDNLRETPNGTGPFIFKDFQPGSSITVERNPHYWDADNIHLDGVRMVFIHDAVAMQAALRAGQVDLITAIPYEVYLVMRRVPGFRAYSAGTGDYQPLQIMGNMAPFDNAKVRQAFYSIPDRKALVASSLFGQGEVGNDIPIPPDSIYAPHLPQREQDLPRAKKLLDDAGVVGGLTVDCYCSSERPPSPKLALAMSEAAAKIGVTIRVQDVPYTEYLANVARKKPMYIGNFSGAATLYDSVYKFYHTSGIYNYSGIEIAPGLDAKLDSLISEVDLEKRKALAAEVLTTIHETNDRMITTFRNYVAVTSDKVQGFIPPKYGLIETRGIWLSA